MNNNLKITPFTDCTYPLLPDLVPILSRDVVYAYDIENKIYLIQVDPGHYDGFFPLCSSVLCIQYIPT